MQTIQRLILGMDNARRFSEGVLSSFKTPEEWTHQLFPGANHAMWFAGHMAMVDNSFLRRVAPEKGLEKPDYAAKFGRGSTATDNPADYPPADELMAFMRDRRKLMMEEIAKFTDADLSKPLPQGFPAFLPDFGQLFAFFAWHEGMHAGQISMVRRALGHPPIVG
jgi:uncharacterized damage-inducible protein DinB